MMSSPLMFEKSRTFGVATAALYARAMPALYHASRFTASVISVTRLSDCYFAPTSFSAAYELSTRT